MVYDNICYTYIMSECFQHIDFFIDRIIDYLEECIKKIYDDSIFNRKKYEKKSPKPVNNVTPFNGVSKQENDEEEIIQYEKEWDIV